MKYESTRVAFFETKYRQNVDPWNFAGSSYEQERYAKILEWMAGHRYARAFEPGCSIGVLTQKLALHCDRLEAIDFSPTAVAIARQRCKGLTHVSIECGVLPDAMPAGKFDLIVFSEIGYYFEEDVLRKIVHRLAQNLHPGGIFLAVHWLGVSVDHVLSGEAVHEIIRNCVSFLPYGERQYAHFGLSRMVRR